jgi:nucleoside-diphosphate-sugar epimerase
MAEEGEFGRNADWRSSISTISSIHGARVLITGGAGMIGSTITHLAVKSGARVTIMDALLPAHGGWRPRTSLQEGIRQTVTCYSKYREKSW